MSQIEFGNWMISLANEILALLGRHNIFSETENFSHKKLIIQERIELQRRVMYIKDWHSNPKH